MSAISSLSSFGARPTQANTFGSAQQAQRNNAFGSAQQTLRTGTVNSTAAARGGNAAGSSSAYCPTCGGPPTSYCPTCNTAGGRQSSVTGFNSNVGQRGAAPNPGAARTGGLQSQTQQFNVGRAYTGR